jgi:hypothetical protein
MVPEPEPVPPAAARPDEERRSSSLRLLRRRVEEPAPVFDGDDEGVRVVRPSEPELESRPESIAAAVDVEAIGEGDIEIVEIVEVEVVTVEVDESVGVEAEPEAVDDLFARLRADRAAAVAHAEKVLAPDEPAPGSEPAPPSLTGADDARFEARDAAIDEAERSLTKALKRALADEQNEVLDNLRRLRGAPELASLLPDEAVHRARYETVATSHLHAAADAAGGATPDVPELALALADEVVGDVRRRLERALDGSTGDEEVLNQSISAAYREWKTGRAEALARHHVLIAHAAAAYAGVPAGTGLRWIVDPGEGNCPDCDDNALAGPTPRGETFPTGQLHPPAHEGCRCLLASVD